MYHAVSITRMSKGLRWLQHRDAVIGFWLLQRNALFSLAKPSNAYKVNQQKRTLHVENLQASSSTNTPTTVAISRIH